MAEGLQRRAAKLLREYWFPLALFVAALVVRLHWNLVVHPIEEYVYSDMRGYLRRADVLFERPWSPQEYHGFYPYGTHVFFYLLKLAFGQDNLDAIGIALAILGASLVVLTHALAKRVSPWPVVPAAVGLIMIPYYPLISLGGYALSEVPFSCALVGSTLLVLKIADEGRNRDAWLLGVVVSLGFVIRPQILATVGLWGLFWLWRRKDFPGLRVGHLVRMSAVLLVVFAASSARLHYHTGRVGLISENGSFNRVFGRCHNKEILALPDRPGRVRTGFAPPAFLQLAGRLNKKPPPWPNLDPALDIKFEYKGYIGDKDIHAAYIRKCLAKTGQLKQLEYALIHVRLLWRDNIMWPDSGRGMWQGPARWWGELHWQLFGLASLWVFAAPFLGRRTVRQAVISCQLWALAIIAAIHIGGIRFRTPYDPFIILAAVEIYAFLAHFALKWLLEAVRRVRARSSGR